MSDAVLNIDNEPRHTNSLARDFALQFLYQCEAEKIFMFAANKCADFVEHFQVTRRAADRMRSLVEGVFAHMPELDQKISVTSKNWQLHRMSVIDRSILRVATYELISQETPTKVVIDEAIELAKKYGTDTSPAFVNGILDTLAKDIRKS